jgi:hypothetical protein
MITCKPAYGGPSVGVRDSLMVLYFSSFLILLSPFKSTVRYHCRTKSCMAFAQLHTIN